MKRKKKMNTINVSKADVMKATIIATEALSFMAKKAGVDSAVILMEITNNPEGNTARYFKDLTSYAMEEFK
jgi:hypothetical protein